jgi:radical SAM protein with 4Fe4S-binding SPASM domain
MCDIHENNIEELSTAHWQQVIADAFKIGAQTIVFSGGEPLLRKDIFDLIACAKENMLKVCITSNGILIDQVYAERLKKAEVNVVNISLEGKELTNDLLRGKGSYQKALRALTALNVQGIETTIACMVSVYNCHELVNVMNIAKEYRATTVRFQPFNPLFIRDKNRSSDFLIDKGNIPLLRSQIEQVKKISLNNNISINPDAYLDRIPEYLGQEKVSVSGGCSALHTSCPINAKGDVFPCWVLADKNTTIGNLKENRLYELWESAAHLNMRKRIQANICQGCLMSCYDQVYGAHDAIKQIVSKAKKVTNADVWLRQKNSLIHNLDRTKRRFKNRYLFYKTYRGSVKQLFVRSFNALRKQDQEQPSNQDEYFKTMSEIQQARNALRKECVRYK